MKIIIISIIIIMMYYQANSQINYFVNMNYCGATYYDKYGYRLANAKNLKLKFPSISYILYYKNKGIEFFYNSFSIGYEPWNKPKDPNKTNVLLFRSRANIGLCFHYFVLKSKIFYLSFFSGFGIKNSMDFTYLFTYYGSFPEPRYDTKDESFKMGLVYGANAKIFLHKRAHINLTLRQMNMIDNAKYQRNTLMTEIGVGARLGRLKKAK